MMRRSQIISIWIQAVMMQRGIAIATPVELRLMRDVFASGTLLQCHSFSTAMAGIGSPRIPVASSNPIEKAARLRPVSIRRGTALFQLRKILIGERPFRRPDGLAGRQRLEALRLRLSPRLKGASLMIIVFFS